MQLSKPNQNPALPGMLEDLKSMLLGIVALAFVSPSVTVTAEGSLTHCRLP